MRSGGRKETRTRIRAKHIRVRCCRNDWMRIYFLFLFGSLTRAGNWHFIFNQFYQSNSCGNARAREQASRQHWFANNDNDNIRFTLFHIHSHRSAFVIDIRLEFLCDVKRGDEANGYHGNDLTIRRFERSDPTFAIIFFFFLVDGLGGYISVESICLFLFCSPN